MGKYTRASFNREFTRPHDLNTHVLSRVTASRFGTGSIQPTVEISTKRVGVLWEPGASARSSGDRPAHAQGLRQQAANWFLSTVILTPDEGPGKDAPRDEAG
ncbi:uncharacterized protein N7479_008085 [Penicillium vulpinum]|uniref:uncharacterized protein n=1 Tax=Penicillium vulpinum TaxID=29845 RepID=UPI002547F6DB|nr:uncharacterized protein N7479_008085 [Penicillium vulpinum]KAJ5960935.1 hypothetical protein N7479_008085 [Penicillium vulpinum]